MKKVFVVFTFYLLTSVFISHSQAMDFFPLNSAQLQEDLDEADGNGQDDTIHLTNTVYQTSENGNIPFLYNSSEDNDLTIMGEGMGISILDGGGDPNGTQVMSLTASGADASITVQGVTVQNGFNGVGDGTGLFVDSTGDAVLRDSEIKTNRDDSAEVVALRIRSGQGSTIVVNNIIHENLAGNVSVASVSNSGNGPIIAEDNLVMNNEADSQSGIGLQNSNNGELIFNRNTVLGNQATNGDFGGVSAVTADGDIIFTNNIIARNSATGNAGGASLNSQNGEIFFVNNTLTGNTAGAEGGGARLSINDVNPTNIFNNIVFGNNGAPGMGEDIFINDIFTVNPTILLFNNIFSEFCVDSGTCDPMDLGPDQGSNLIGMNPLFVNPANDDYRLGVGSPALNTADPNPPGGLPDPDHDGNTRPFGPAPDIGALEAIPQLATDPGNLAFGSVEVGSSGTLTLTLENLGTVLANISNLILSDAVHYSLNPQGGNNPCGSLNFDLPGGGSCTLEVEFNPTLTGILNATLTIQSNDPKNPDLVVNLSGTGTDGGGCSLGKNSRGHPKIWGAFGIFLLCLSYWRTKNRHLETKA